MRRRIRHFKFIKVIKAWFICSLLLSALAPQSCFVVSAEPNRNGERNPRGAVRVRRDMRTVQSAGIKNLVFEVFTSLNFQIPQFYAFIFEVHSVL